MKKFVVTLLSTLFIVSLIHAQVINGTLNHQGITRTYITYLPTSYTPGSNLPVVFVLHALTMNGQRMMQVSGFNAVAEANNFIAVYPDGIAGTWNVNFPVPSNVDDVGFIDALVDEMVNLYNVDLNRVYACGLSNGGFLSYKLACESSKCFAAVASVSGVMTDAAFGMCTPTRSVPIMHIHGTADGTVAYTGVPGVLKSVDEVLAYWLFNNNNCTGNPTVTRIPDTNPFDFSTVDRFVWNPCDNGAEVQLLRVNGGGHQWPGTSTLLGGLGTINRDINASQEIWNFFSRFTCNQTATNPIPAAPTVTPSPAVVCQLGGSITLTATAPGGNYEWFSGAIGGTPIGTGASFTTPPLFSSATYWVQATVGGLTSPRTQVTVNFNVSPLVAPLVTALPPAVCSGNTSVLTATPPVLGNINWYDAATGGNLLGSGGVFTTPALTSTATYWAEPVRGNCTGPRTAVTVTVNPLPATPTANASPATICQGATSTLTASGSSGIYQWYDSQTGGILLWTGPSYTALPLATTTYYVQTTDANGCNSARTAVTVNVNPLPAAPTASASPASICSGSSTTLTATAPGGTYEWFNVPVGGTALASGASFTTPALNLTTVYYVQTTDANGCTSLRTPVTVTVQPTPLAPLATALPASVCSGNASLLTSTLPVLGTINWYDAATGGNLLGSGATYTSPALTATTTYWAEPVRGGCVGPRTAVTVTVNPLPAAPTVSASPSTVCQGSSSTLTATGGSGTFTWYNAPTGGALLWVGASYTTLPLLNTTTFYVQETDANLCSSPRTAVTVTVNPLPAAPTATASPGTICAGNTSTLTATAPGGTYEWFDLPVGGTNLGTGASFTTPALSFTTVYWVQTTDANGCVSPRTPVTVNVTPVPPAPVVRARPATICAGSSSLLISRAINTTNWYDAPSGGNLLGTGRTFNTPALTSTTTYYAETAIGSCTGPRTAVTVTVNPLPAAPTLTASPSGVCYGSSTTITASGPGGVYQWYTAPAGGALIWVGSTFNTPSLFSNTTYYVQTTNGNLCTSPRTAITITVKSFVNPPTVTTPAPVCSGASATISASTNTGTITWYSAATAGSALGTGATFTTPALNGTTRYWVAAESQNCSSIRVPVTVTVIPTPIAPFARAWPSTVCSGGVAFALAASPGATISWYDAPTGGNLLATGPFFQTPSLTATTTYYAEPSIQGCIGPRAAVTVTLGNCKKGNGNGNGSDKDLQSDLSFLKVYPNPSDGKIKLNYSGEEKSFLNLNIYDINGKLVYADEYTQDTGLLEYNKAIDLTHLTEGIYVLQVLTDDQNLMRKLVIN